MPEAFEEENVPRRHLRLRDTTADAVQRVRVVRKLDPDPEVRPADESGAVEPGLGGFAAPAVRHTNLPERDPRRTLRSRRRLLDSRGRPDLARQRSRRERSRSEGCQETEQGHAAAKSR